MDEEWVTLEWKSGETVTRRVRETVKVKYGFEARPATSQEIEAELDRRRQEENIKYNAQLERERKKREFEVRQDYDDACVIASVLDVEWFTPDDHPLDRLSPAEWAELRRRLTA